MSEQNCGNCRFWKANRNSERNGECRAHPRVYSETYCTSVFPDAPSDDWCGEWQASAERIEELRQKVMAEASNGILTVVPYTPAEKELQEENARLRDMICTAWGVIANAHGGDWSKASAEWKEAASKWRDLWFGAFSPTTPPLPKEQA